MRSKQRDKQITSKMALRRHPSSVKRRPNSRFFYSSTKALHQTCLTGINFQSNTCDQSMQLAEITYQTRMRCLRFPLIASNCSGLIFPPTPTIFTSTPNNTTPPGTGASILRSGACEFEAGGSVMILVFAISARAGLGAWIGVTVRV